MTESENENEREREKHRMLRKGKYGKRVDRNWKIEIDIKNEKGSIHEKNLIILLEIIFYRSFTEDKRLIQIKIDSEEQRKK